MRQVVAAMALLIGVVALVDCGDEQASHITRIPEQAGESGNGGEAGGSESNVGNETAGDESTQTGGGAQTGGRGGAPGERGGSDSAKGGGDTGDDGIGGKGAASTARGGGGGHSGAASATNGRGGSATSSSSDKCAAGVANMGTCTTSGDTCELATDAGVAQTCTCGASTTMPVIGGRDAGAKTTWKCVRNAAAGGTGGKK